MNIIGHRGAKGLSPENTLASIETGLAQHVDAIEIDVRVTKDGIPVLMHDDSLQRVANNPMRIAESTYKALLAVKPDLPTLEQALTTISNRVPVRIEIKPDIDIKPVVSVITAYAAKGWDINQISLASFSQQTLLAIHAALPSCPVVVNESWSSWRAGRRARALGTKSICMNQRWLWFGFIHAMYKRGFKLEAYPLNNPKKARLWQRFGLHGVMTDYPDRFNKS